MSVDERHELEATPSQTVGPYFSIGLTWVDGQFAVEEGTPGRIWIRGRVTDVQHNQVTIRNVALKPGKVQRTRTWMYGQH